MGPGDVRHPTHFGMVTRLHTVSVVKVRNVDAEPALENEVVEGAVEVRQGSELRAWEACQGMPEEPIYEGV